MKTVYGALAIPQATALFREDGNAVIAQLNLLLAALKLPCAAKATFSHFSAPTVVRYVVELDGEEAPGVAPTIEAKLEAAAAPLYGVRAGGFPLPPPAREER